MYERRMPRLTLSRCARAIPLLALAAIFGWAAWERFRLPLTPYTDGDLGAYLSPGMSKLLGGEFRHVYGQCFLYPAFLYTVLGVARDFRAVTLVQHLLGLGTGALLFGCWRQLRRLLPAARLPGVIFQLLGVVMTGTYLVSTTAIEFERVLRPESIFPFVATLHILCNLRFIGDRFLEGGRRPRRVLLAGGAAVFFSVAAWLLKPSFSAMLMLANLPVLISLFHDGQSARGKLVLIGAPVIAAAVLLVGPEWWLRRTDPMGEFFLARSLFSIHANLIDEQMAEDLATRANTPYAPEVLADAHAALTEALRASGGENARYWPALGFDADYLLHANRERESYMHWLQARLGGNAARLDFCRYYYWRVIRRHPEKMAAKVVHQMKVFYHWGDCPAYTTYDTREVAKDYQRSVEILVNYPELPRYPPGVALIARLRELQTSPLRIGPYPVTAWMNGALAAGYLGSCFGAMLLGLAAWGLPPARRVFRGIAPVLLLLFSYNFGTVLTLAIGHSLDIGRYSMYQLAYTLLPEFGAVWIAVEVLAAAVLAVLGLPWCRRVWSWLKIRITTALTSAHPPAATLPGLARKSAPPSVSTILLEDGGRGPDPTTISARLDGTDATGVLDALEQCEGEVLVMITGADTDGFFAETKRQLVEAYAAAPVDLLVLQRATQQWGATRYSTRMLRFAFGWSPADPASGAWLCSRRFYRRAPVFATRDTRALQLEMTAFALDRGFLIREVTAPVAPAVDSLGHRLSWEDARVLGGLLACCARARPAKTLGAMGLALVLLGAVLGYLPLRHLKDNRYGTPVARILTSVVCLAGGLLSLQAGLLLHVAQRPGREAFQLGFRRDDR